MSSVATPLIDPPLIDPPARRRRARLRQARRKADALVGLVQGTSALEAQAVDAASLRRMRKRVMRELLEGPPRRLWAA